MTESNCPDLKTGDCGIGGYCPGCPHADAPQSVEPFRFGFGEGSFIEPKEVKTTVSLTIREEETNLGLLNRDNLEMRVDWINALRGIVSRRIPKNKSGMSLVSDIDIVLASDEERTEALGKIKGKYESGRTK